MNATLAVAALPGQAYGGASPTSAPSAPIPAALMAMDLVPPLAAPAPGDRGEMTALRIRLRGSDGRERVASFPRSLLQRLVRGREIDLTPDRSLQAFTPAAEVLGTARVLMVLASPDETRPPWAGPIAKRPGEEDAARLAFALTRWWAGDPPPAAAAVVGADPVASPARWARAPLVDGKISVVAEESAFPAQSRSLRAGLLGLAGGAGSPIVLIVTAEPPGVLGRRLRTLAVDPSFAGKIVAVASLGGPLRADLPASLLGEGRLAALGVYEAGPVGVSKSIAQISSWARVVASEGSKGRRVEELPGPFTWFY
jgi:hypothetical protein